MGRATLPYPILKRGGILIKRKIHLDSQKKEYKVILTNISGKPLGQIPHNAITSITRNLNEPDTIAIKIPRYYMDMSTLTQKTYPLYYCIKNERLILLDDTDVFVIREIKNTNDQILEITCKSREIRLEDIRAKYEDCGFYFFESDNKKQLEERIAQLERRKLIEIEPNIIKLVTDELEKLKRELQGRRKNEVADFYSLDSELFRYTGWRVGEVSDLVRYSTKREEKDWTKNTKPDWYSSLESQIDVYESKIKSGSSKLSELEINLARTIDEHPALDENGVRISGEDARYTAPIRKQIAELNIQQINDITERDKLIRQLSDKKKVHWEEISEAKKFEADKWLESVDKTWYDFLSDDFKDRYDCEIIFDPVNKKVHFFKEEELPDEIKLILSKDNYIKSMERVYETDKLVTQLLVEGNEEMDITNAVCTGSPYIENYQYFLENDEMSDELVEALNKYYKMVEKREPEWRKIADEIIYLEDTKSKMAGEFTINTSKYNAYGLVLESQVNLHKTNPIHYGEITSKMQKCKNNAEVLELKIRKLEEEIDALNKSLKNITTLCQKPTATDDDGVLIFNEKTLEELKNFTYMSEYKNDSFLTDNIGQLIALAKRKLRDMSYPTRSWDIEVSNFLNRIINKDGYSWQGQLSLGDIVVLYDRETDTEEMVYLTGCTQSVHGNDLSITLSNKKTTKEDGKTIADYLNQARNSMRILDSKKYLLIQQKYNRLNLPKEYIPKYKEEKPKYQYGTMID